MAMTWQAWLVLISLSLVLILLFLEKSPPEQTLLALLLVYWFAGIITENQAIRGFGNSSIITIGSLFIVVEAVDRSGLIGLISTKIMGERTGEYAARARMCVSVFFLSAFLNNIPIVSLLIPIILDYCNRRGYFPSKFMMPMSFATVMGGQMTTIGTSTNLVINGLMEARQIKGFEFFEPGYVAFPVAIVSMIWICTIGSWMLPSKGAKGEESDQKDDFITAVEVPVGSRLVGREASEVLALYGIRPWARLLCIRHGGAPKQVEEEVETEEAKTQTVEAYMDVNVEDISEKLGLQNTTESPEAAKPFTVVVKRAASRDESIELLSLGYASTVEMCPVQETERVQANDVLLLSLSRKQIVHLHRRQDLKTMRISSLIPEPDSESGEKVNRCDLKAACTAARKSLSTSLCKSNASAGLREDVFVELILGLNNPLIGQPVQNGSALLRKTYNAGLVAVRPRRVEQEPGKLEVVSEENPIPFLSTETFSAGDALLVLAAADVEFAKDDFFIISPVGKVQPPVRWWDYVPAILFVAGLILAATDVFSMTRIALTLAVFFILGGWIDSKEIVNIIEWNVLIMIGAALGLAEGMDGSGLAKEIAALVSSANLPYTGLCILLMAVTVVITEIVTNNAAAALGIPLAVALARVLKIDPRGLCMVVLQGSTAGFASPIGYACNLMVVGPGGYSFFDFVKSGIWHDAIWIVGIGLMSPVVFPPVPL